MKATKQFFPEKLVVFIMKFYTFLYFFFFLSWACSCWFIRGKGHSLRSVYCIPGKSKFQFLWQMQEPKLKQASAVIKTINLLIEDIVSCLTL